MIFGTTNSCVRDGRAAAHGDCPTEGFRTTLPSVVAYTRTQDKAGVRSPSASGDETRRTPSITVKRFIGRRVDEVNEKSKEVIFTA